MKELNRLLSSKKKGDKAKKRICLLQAEVEGEMLPSLWIVRMLIKLWAL